MNLLFKAIKRGIHNQGTKTNGQREKHLCNGGIPDLYTIKDKGNTWQILFI